MQFWYRWVLLRFAQRRRIGIKREDSVQEKRDCVLRKDSVPYIWERLGPTMFVYLIPEIVNPIHYRIDFAAGRANQFVCAWFYLGQGDIAGRALEKPFNGFVGRIFI